MSTNPTPLATQAAELQEQNKQLEQAIDQQQQTNEPQQLQREYVVELETGQVYRGRTQQELIDKLKDAQINASKRIHELDEKLKAKDRPALSPEQQAEVDAQKWIADQQAKWLGYADADEMKRDLGELREYKEQTKYQQTIQTFHQQNPDFPATEDAADAVMAIMKEANLPFNPRGLQAAHLMALKEGKYQPVSQEANNQVNRPPVNPLPTVPSRTNPTGTGQSEEDAFANMNAQQMEDYLRKQYETGRR